MSDSILDVDLLAFEQGGNEARRAVVDGVMQSLKSGFVYTSHDVGDDLIDTAYGMLETFFSLSTEAKQTANAPGSFGQTGYTGLLVETAAISDHPDWKEMLNWGREIPAGHPLQRKYPHLYPNQVFPEDLVPGISEVLGRFHDRVLDTQRRFLRIIAQGIGCHESFFDVMTTDSPTLSRAIHYPSMEQAPSSDGSTTPHVWAAEHGDINLITALPRATAKGLQVKTDSGWIDAVPPEGGMIMNTGIMLEHLTNGVIPVGVHQVVADPDQPGERYSVVQFCHATPWTILSPVTTCITPDNPQRHAPISAADRLDLVLYEINLVEDARRVEPNERPS